MRACVCVCHLLLSYSVQLKHDEDSDTFSFTPSLLNARSFPEWKSPSSCSRPCSMARTSATSVRKECSFVSRFTPPEPLPLFPVKQWQRHPRLTRVTGSIAGVWRSLSHAGASTAKTDACNMDHSRTVLKEVGHKIKREVGHSIYMESVDTEREVFFLFNIIWSWLWQWHACIGIWTGFQTISTLYKL